MAPGLSEELHLLVAGHRRLVSWLISRRQVGDELKVPVLGPVQRQAGAKGILAKTGKPQALGHGDDQGLHGQGHLLPLHLHDLRERRGHRLAELADLGEDHGASADGIPPTLQVGKVGEDVVGVHAGFPDHHIGGDDERELFRVLEHLDLQVPRGRGQGRGAVVEPEDLYGVSVASVSGGDDLLVDVIGVGEPRPLGRVAVPLEKGAALVRARVFTVQLDPEGGEGPGCILSTGKGWPSLVPLPSQAPPPFTRPPWWSTLPIKKLRMMMAWAA